MKKAIFILGLLGLIFSGELYGQQKICAHNSTMQQFYSLFNEVEFDVLHVYTLGRVSGSFHPENTYLFKGVEIDTSLHHLLKNVIPEVAEKKLFAIYRFYISTDFEALVLRTYQDPEHHIHYLIYNNVKHEFVKDIEIAYSYAYEGNFGGMESWIIDLNKDGKKDIVTRSWAQSLIGSDAFEINHDSVIISIWKENELVSVGISDTLLKKQLVKDFPYFTEPNLGYDTEKKLSAYLKEKVSIEIPEYNEENWCIITGNNKDLSNAKNEIERAEKIIGMNHKYGLDIRLFEIHKKNELYYTIITRFKTKTEAEVALMEIKKKFNNTAYLINYNKWCKKSDYHAGGYYECIN